MLQQSRREYNRPLWVAYVDLKAAFDSVDRNALWFLLASSGFPPEIINLFKALYTDTHSCVRVDGYDSEWFSVLSGVRQGCVVAPGAVGSAARGVSAPTEGGEVRGHIVAAPVQLVFIC